MQAKSMTGIKLRGADPAADPSAVGEVEAEAASRLRVGTCPRLLFDASAVEVRATHGRARRRVATAWPGRALARVRRPRAGSSNPSGRSAGRSCAAGGRGGARTRGTMCKSLPPRGLETKRNCPGPGAVGPGIESAARAIPAADICVVLWSAALDGCVGAAYSGSRRL